MKKIKLLIIVVVILSSVAIGSGLYYQQKEVNLLNKNIVELDENIKACHEVLDETNKKFEDANLILDKTEENLGFTKFDYKKALKTIQNYQTINDKSFKEFSYSDFGNDFKVIKNEFKVLDIFNAEELSGSSCIPNKGLDYFKNVLFVYNKDDKGIEYNIEYNKPSQLSAFRVTVIPNKSYKNGDSFMDDFSICAAGGQRYPELQSDKYLLFISSCGSGYGDGSGLPNGCDEVKEIVLPTLKIN